MSDTTPKLNFEKSYAYLIGVNAYRSERLASLKTAVRDAIAVAHKLTGHGYEPKLLLDDGLSETNRALFREIFGEEADPAGLILPEAADRENIERLLLEIIPGKLREGDRIFFYFAGHGIADDVADDDDEKPQGYLMPVDADPEDFASLVSMNTVNEALARWSCRHGLIVFDCCFAGAFQWSLRQTRGDIVLPKQLFDRRFVQYAEDPAWQVITSSASDQEAVDLFRNRVLGRRDHDGAHSPFARALLDGLDGAADLGIVEGEADGVITATELYLYLRQRVETETLDRSIRQTPAIFNLATKHDKGEFLFLNPRSPLNLPPFPEQNPFRGLEAYREEDASFFYGRDRAVTGLLDQLGKIGPPAIRTVFLSGGTGCGKTSLVQAGILPRLRKPGSGWRVLKIIRPTDYLRAADRAFFTELSADLNGDEKKLLIVDQYEEMITRSIDRKRWLDFEQELAKLLEQHALLYVLIVLRNNYEYQLQRPDSPLAGWWRQSRWAMPMLRPEDLREMIVQPAGQAVLFYEPAGLVDRILDEVDETPEALPMLSFTLHRLVEKAGEGRKLTSEAYEEIGGVGKAIWSQADAVFNRLDDRRRQAMRKILLRMVRLENGAFQKRKIPYLIRPVDAAGSMDSAVRTELLHELDYPENSDDLLIEEVIGELTKARLIHSPPDQEIAEQLYVEPVHDALITAWPRILDWIRDFGEDKLRLQRQLWEAAVEYRNFRLGPTGKQDEKQKAAAAGEPDAIASPLWDNNPKLQEVLKAILDPKDQLLGGGRPEVNALADRLWNMELTPEDQPRLRELFQHFPWRVDRRSMPEWRLLTEGEWNPEKLIDNLLRLTDHWLNETEIQFVRESWRRRQSKIAQLREQRDEAVRRMHIAEAHATVAKAQALQRRDMAPALRFCEEAWNQLTVNNIPPTPIVQQALSGIFYQQYKGRAFPFAQPLPERIVAGGAPVEKLVVAPDHRSFLTLSKDGQVSIGDPDGRSRGVLSTESPAVSAQYLPGETPLIAVVTGNGKVHLYTLDGAFQSTLETAWPAPPRIAVNPSGRHFVVFADGGPAQLWSTGGALQMKLSKKTQSGFFSPGGRYVLLFRTDRSAELWDTESHLMTKLAYVGGQERPYPSTADFTSDETHLLVCWQGEVYLYELKPERPPKLTVKFSDSLFVSPSGDELPYPPASRPEKFREKSGYTMFAQFSEDGRQVLTRTENGLAAIRDLQGQRLAHGVEAGILPEVPGEYNYCAPRLSRFLPGDAHVLTVYDAQASPDIPSGILYDNTYWRQTFSIRIWNNRKKVPFYVSDHHAHIAEVFISPDEQLIAGLYRDGLIKIWDRQNTLVAEITAPGRQPKSLHFIGDPDDYRLVTLEQNGNALLWRLGRQGSLLEQLPGQHPNLAGGFFFPDGRLLVYYDRPARFQIWDRAGNRLRETSMDAGDPMRAKYQVVGSPSGALILAANGFSFRLYDAAGKPLSEAVETEDWNSFSTVRFLADDEQIAVVYGEPKRKTAIYRWSGAKIELLRTLEGLELLALSTDGRMGALRGEGLSLWRPEEEGFEPLAPAASVSSACFSPDNRFLLAAGGREVYLWEWAGNKPSARPFQARQGVINHIAWSPDGRSFVIASEDATARIWRPDDPAGPSVALRCPGPVREAVFSRNGRYVLTRSADQAAQLWDSAGRLLAELDQHAGALTLALLTPEDPPFALTASEDQTIRFWPSPEAIYEWLRSGDCPLPASAEKVTEQ